MSFAETATLGEEGAVAHVGEEVAEHVAEEVADKTAVQAEEEVAERAEQQIKEITIPEENKIPRDQLNPPTKEGNAPTFKKDGKSVEIHHENQNPDGPFREIHPDEHRKIPNPRKQL